MSRKRDVLEQLKRDELLAAVDLFELPVEDRRVRSALVEALAGSRKAGLTAILEDLPRTRLKEICRELGLDDSGREKATLVARLAGDFPVAPSTSSMDPSPTGSAPPASINESNGAPQPRASQPRRTMALKKSELYSSLWAELRRAARRHGRQPVQGLRPRPAVHQVRQRQVRRPALRRRSSFPTGASFKDMVALKGKSDIGDKINKKIIAPLADANKLLRLPRLQRRQQARQRQGDGGPAHQPDRHLREPGPRLLQEPRRGRRHPRRRLRIPDAALRHRERQEQGPVLHARRGQPHHRPGHRHLAREDQRRHHRLRPDLRLRLAAAQGGRRGRHATSRSTGRRRTLPPAASPA